MVKSHTFRNDPVFLTNYSPVKFLPAIRKEDKLACHLEPHTDGATYIVTVEALCGKCGNQFGEAFNFKKDFYNENQIRRGAIRDKLKTFVGYEESMYAKIKDAEALHTYKAKILAKLPDVKALRAGDMGRIIDLIEQIKPNYRLAEANYKNELENKAKKQLKGE